MKIICLVENTSENPAFQCAHGLSLYIETKNHKILFDVGPNELFAENAKSLNVNISEIDTVIISHGHYDHGGGLKTFFELNDKANVYVHEGFFEAHFSISRGPEPRFIGIDPSLKCNGRFIFVGDNYRIDDELYLFANPPNNEFISLSNRSLLIQQNEKYIPDPFNHEQSLIITQNSNDLKIDEKDDFIKNNNVLFCGCSHRGIANILTHAETIIQSEFDFVIGGFHLMNPSKKTVESFELLENIANELQKRKKTKFYTCHCTGLDAYKHLHDKMKANIDYLSTSKMIYA
ncbi:metallo-beta-lactamase [Tritrichomonas foetus]|uniref:Metallo-beta-lactamase n=1 Tax=Tritrichomonas foetus TaxID=1144522 RepID=A0A1J4J3C4_9EUKA|nr:metallo-beta-lactamase [Tritrichomonas foetus]|eukprot:OHS93241.1 metallo-beta-lactamase [Tritrichomonas foetus]